MIICVYELMCQRVIDLLLGRHMIAADHNLQDSRAPSEAIQMPRNAGRVMSTADDNLQEGQPQAPSILARSAGLIREQAG